MHRLRPLILVLLLASLCALGLAGGCTESGSLPTQPVTPGPVGPWTVIYPITTTEDLNGVWGADADDMWAVGDEGTIRHFDGGEWQAEERYLHYRDIPEAP